MTLSLVVNLKYKLAIYYTQTVGLVLCCGCCVWCVRNAKLCFYNFSLFFFYISNSEFFVCDCCVIFYLLLVQVLNIVCRDIHSFVRSLALLIRILIVFFTVFWIFLVFFFEIILRKIPTNTFYKNLKRIKKRLMRSV